MRRGVGQDRTFAGGSQLNEARPMNHVSPVLGSPMNSTDRVKEELSVPTKACPVVLRRTGDLEVLAFEHPLAGFQLVKGSIEQDESPAAAAVRELLEESGLKASSVSADLGLWVPGY